MLLLICQAIKPVAQCPTVWHFVGGWCCNHVNVNLHFVRRCINSSSRRSRLPPFARLVFNLLLIWNIFINRRKQLASPQRTQQAPGKSRRRSRSGSHSSPSAFRDLWTGVSVSFCVAFPPTMQHTTHRHRHLRLKAPAKREEKPKMGNWKRAKNVSNTKSWLPSFQPPDIFFFQTAVCSTCCWNGDSGWGLWMRMRWWWVNHLGWLQGWGNALSSKSYLRRSRD